MACTAQLQIFVRSHSLIECCLQQGTLAGKGAATAVKLADLVGMFVHLGTQVLI